MNTPSESPMADAEARETASLHRRRLRRFAYKHRLTLKQARNWKRIHARADYLALIRAELALAPAA